MKAPIVFDLDGTLIDSLPDIVAAVNKMLSDFNKPPLRDALIRSFVGKGLPNLVDRVRDASGLTDEPAFERTHAHYNAAPSDLTQLYPGVINALDALKRTGHPLGICTNKEHELTLPVLKDLRLASYFDVVIGGNSRPTRKPDPEPLLHGFRELGAETGIFIGDSEVDAETGHRAGVPFGLYTNGYRKSPIDQILNTFSFDSFEDLPGLISALR